MFEIRNLAVLSYAHGFTSWLYKAGNSPLTEIQSPNYFAQASDIFAKGDVITIVAEGYTAIRHVSEVSPEYVRIEKTV